ncbi:MAG: hypothetical protein ACOYI5_11260, partial [Christensenellales bacterium]
VTFLWNVAANLPGAYFTVYLLRDLGVSYSYITIISMLNIPVTLFLTPIWRKALAKNGWFKTLYRSIAVYLVHYLVLAFVTGRTLFLYPVSQILAYVFAVGINLSFTGIPYVNMPEKRQTVFIGFYSSASNFAALLGVTLGRYFVVSTDAFRFELFGMTFVNKQVLVAIAAVLLGGAALGIRAIDKRTPSDW